MKNKSNTAAGSGCTKRLVRFLLSLRASPAPVNVVSSECSPLKTMSWNIITIENGKISERKSLTEPTKADPAIGDTVQGEQSGKSKMWFRSRYGINETDELLNQ